MNADGRYCKEKELIKVIMKKPHKSIEDIFHRLLYDVRAHSIRVGKLTFLMANAPELMEEFGFSDENLYKKAITDGGRYHDLGKMMISEMLLNKESRLTDTEWQLIKRHPLRTAELIEQYIDPKEYTEAYYNTVLLMGKYHHEKYDGTGYPYGLSGEDIPFLAQLTAVADATDALISRRSYKEPIRAETAAQIILADEGKKFSPRAIAQFRKYLPQIFKIGAYKK